MTAVWSRRWTEAIRRAVVVVSVTTLVAACGGSDDTGPAPADVAAQESTDSRTTDPAATLTFTYAIAVNGFDPAKPATQFDLAYMRPVYDSLLRRDEDGTIGPGLATDYKFDNRALVLTLRDGIVFSDGTPFDADVVRANLERTKTIEGSTQASLLQSVATVEVVDSHTVRLDLQGGGAEVPGALTTFPGLMMSPAAFTQDLKTNAIGTGPYQLAHVETGIVAEYVPNARAWEPDHAAAGHLRIINQADSGQRLNQMRTGQADAANMDVNLVAEAEAAGMQVLAKEANNSWLLNINTARPALASVEARRAVNEALDREGLLQGLDFGFGTISAQLQPENEAGANPDVTPAFNPDDAKTLAQQSGLSSHTLRLLGSAIPTITSYLEAIQAQLADIGVQSEIVSVERAQLVNEVQGGNWDLYMNFWPGAADPWITYNAVLGKDSIYFPGELPADVAALIDRVRSEFDPDKRSSDLRELAKAVDEQQLVSVLSHPRRPMVANPNIVNFHGNVHAIPELRGSGIAAAQAG